MDFPTPSPFAPEEFVKILVFMDVSSPDLVDAAAQAQASIVTALRNLEGVKRRVFVRVLVHGYQSENAVEIDSRLLRFDRPHDAPKEALVWGSNNECRAPVVPADGEALRQFVIQSLLEPTADDTKATKGKKAKDEAIPRPFRSVLFLWGHGEGVGNRLERAEGSKGASSERLPASVVGTSLLGARSSDCSALRMLRDVPAHLNWRGPIFDLIVFDSCLMATAELAFECRDLSRFVIASQSFVMRPGLRLGTSVAEYLATIEHSALLQPHGKGGPQAGAPRVPPTSDASAVGTTTRRLADYPIGIDPGLDAAKAIIDTAGDLHSGADQLSLFRVQPRMIPAGTPSLNDHDSLARWIAITLDLIRNNKCSPESLLRSGPYSPPNVWEPLVGRLDLGLSRRYPFFGVFAAFCHLLRWASADLDEHPRIVTAFRNALFVQARQFLDLKDLARQVYHYSRLVPLRLVALELMREMEERDQGFVVRWRATISESDKKRYGGVSLYCPWFEAQGTREFDAVVEHDVYMDLDLPRLTGWAGFVLGPMYDSTAGQRERAERCAQIERSQDRRWLRLLKEAICDCCPPGAGSPPMDRDQLGPLKKEGPQGDIKGSGPQAQFPE